MPLQTLEPRRLYRQIVDQISLLIGDGEYTSGARLPPEPGSARRLGVSRPSLREVHAGVLKESKPITIRSTRTGCCT